MKITRRAIALLALTAVLATSSAVPVDAAEAHDVWYAFYVAGGKAGHVHETRVMSEEDGRSVWTTRTDVSFSLSRVGMPLTIVQNIVVVEDETGQVIRFSQTVEQGGPPQVTKGTVADGKITIDQMGVERTSDYPEGAIGPAAAQRKLSEKRPVPGMQVEFTAFSPEAPDTKVTATTIFGEMEKVDVLGRVVMLRKVEMKNSLVPIVTQVWVDKKGGVLAAELDFGMGPCRYLRTEKEIALAESEPVEVMTTSFVQPDRPIEGPRELSRAVYRIGKKDGAAPSIYQGEGQSVLVEEKGSLHVQVLALRPGDDTAIFSLPVTDEALEKYLSPTAFVESDDALVIELANEAVGDETDAVKAADLIEAFVREKIVDKNLGVGFASAAEVAKTLEGDCTEHAVLCCALARAKGLPARVVTGLVYLPPPDDIETPWPNGFFGYHMWTEVLVADGHWLPIDAAIGTYDATHIAISKSDLSSVNPGLEMIIAVLKTLGSLTIEVVEP